MKILAVDTSAKVTSVSIVEDNTIISEFNVNTKLTHSQTLMPMLKSALECAHVSLCEIDGFAAAVGPGSFTGLRIGISAIKGLAYACNKPCVAVSTLEALSKNMQGVDGIICAAMDARCSQVYTALFSSSKDGINRITQDLAITIDELFEKLIDINKNSNKKVFLVGDGADLCYNKFSLSPTDEKAVGNIEVADCGKKYQRSAMVGICAISKFIMGDICSAAELMPAYLRLPQAQRERIAKLGHL